MHHPDLILLFQQDGSVHLLRKTKFLLFLPKMTVSSNFKYMRTNFQQTLCLTMKDWRNKNNISSWAVYNVMIMLFPNIVNACGFQNVRTIIKLVNTTNCSLF